MFADVSPTCRERPFDNKGFTHCQLSGLPEVAMCGEEKLHVTCLQGYFPEAVLHVSATSVPDFLHPFTDRQACFITLFAAFLQPKTTALAMVKHVMLSSTWHFNITESKLKLQVLQLCMPVHVGL